MKIGVAHTTLLEADHSIPDPATVAREIEGLGLDSMWASDHLAWDMPILDSALTLAAGAAATERIELGFCVLQLALRPLAWAAKHIGTLQAISGDRLILGVGIGGRPEYEWHAAGKPLATRARQTDEALEALPALLAGKQTPVPDAGNAPVTLLPAATVPPVLIGGGSDAALRRVIRFGDGWLPAAIPLDDLRAGQAKLRELSEEHGRQQPGTVVSTFATLDAHLGGMSHDALVEMMTGWGFPRDVADSAVLSGTPQQVAERLAAHAELGVRHLIVSAFGGDWRRQCELLAEAKALL